MNSKVEGILNVQIQKEAYSSHLYLAMASWADTKGLKGVSAWLFAQSDEERMHMLKLVNYVNERGGNVKISSLDEPPQTFDNVQSMFEAVLKHEQFITDSINEIVAVCNEQKDFTTHNWIQWFVTEQIEEEASVNDILDKLRLIGDGNLYLFDRDIMAMRKSEESDG